MADDNLALALHALHVSGVSRAALSADGVLSWIPASNLSSSTSASSSSTGATTTNPSSSSDSSSSTSTTSTTSTASTETASSSSSSSSSSSVVVISNTTPNHVELAVAGCKLLHQLCHNNALNKMETVSRGGLHALGNAMEHDAKDMRLQFTAIRAVKTITFKFEAGKRAAHTSGIIKTIISALRHAVKALEGVATANETTTTTPTVPDAGANASSSSSSSTSTTVSDPYLALAVLEEATTTLASLCTGVCGEESTIAIQTAGFTKESGELKQIHTLVSTQLKWPLPGVALNPIAVRAAGLTAVPTPTEIAKRVFFLEALL